MIFVFITTVISLFSLTVARAWTGLDIPKRLSVILQHYIGLNMDLKKYVHWIVGGNQNPVPWSENWRSIIGGIAGGTFVAFLAKFIGEFTQINDWAMASLGASALLVFVLPSSPMAQPKAVIGGNLIAALVGVSCAILIPDVRISMPLAIGISILGMLYFNCLHAPAAATALSAVLGHIITFRYALFPVLIDSILLVIAGILYNKATYKKYPHPQNLQNSSSKIPVNNQYGDELAINQALSKYKEFIDINSGDLANIINQVELHAYEQRLKAITCSDIMTQPIITVEMATPLEIAWKQIRENHIKALPVVDKNSRVVGIITLEDFLRSAAVDFHQSFGQRLKGFMRNGFKQTHSNFNDAYPNSVGQIMQKPVRVISSNRNVLDLVGIFEGDGHHHLPVIDENKLLVGIITQSDFVRAIHNSMDLSA